MPKWTSSIVRNAYDHDVYLVVDGFGRNGRCYREAEIVIKDLLEGQFSNPIRVVALNTAVKWSRDVSAYVAHELRHRCNEHGRDVPFGLRDFADRLRVYHDIQLPLPLSP
jgi:hypothetical protein